MAVSLGSIPRNNPLSELSHALLSWWGGAGPEGPPVLQPVLFEAEFHSAIVVVNTPAELLSGPT